MEIPPGGPLAAAAVAPAKEWGWELVSIIVIPESCFMTCFVEEPIGIPSYCLDPEEAAVLVFYII